jgi:non-specific serine/threonine protein kinase
VEETALPAGAKLGHYVIADKVGEGGMGIVYRATDVRLRREVALKFLRQVLSHDEKRLARFEHEAHVLASLNHPNIAAIYGIEDTSHGQALVLEFIQGDTLAQRLQVGPLDSQDVVSTARQISEALAAAHERGIIHRDLKPANVKITPEGRVKVLDFGLATELPPAPEKLLGEESTGDTPMEWTGVPGTLPYMAPEQLRGEPLDARTDVFSLGVLLYEMATGQRPFPGSSGARLIGDIQHSTPRSPHQVNPEVPDWLDHIIMKCQEKEPDRRFPSMRAVSEALAAELDSDSPSPVKSLAVLYFENPGGSEEDVYFRDGIAEDIMIELAKIGDLRVMSRSAVQAYRDAPIGATQVGAALGAAFVLDGTLRRIGNHLRITAQLVDTNSERTIWAERFDGDIEDVFQIQDQIARRIAAALRVVLSEAEKRALTKVPTRNVEAYECYLRARQYFRQFRRKSIEYALKTVEKAIEIDPQYAAAWAALADCHSYLDMFWEATDEHRREADRASRRAVELDPELPEAYVARGVAISITERYDEADEEFQKAIRLDPTSFEAYYFQARGHYARGNLERAVHWFDCAIAVRPEDYQSPSLMASALRGLGREEEARQAFRLALDRGRKLLEVEPGNTRALYFSALALGQLGEDSGLAIEWGERALSMDPEEPQVLYNVGCLFALLGKPQRALDCLAATLEHGGWWKTWMRNDPDLAVLHGNPRFQELVDEPEPPAS